MFITPFAFKKLKYISILDKFIIIKEFINFWIQPDYKF